MMNCTKYEKSKKYWISSFCNSAAQLQACHERFELKVIIMFLNWTCEYGRVSYRVSPVTLISNITKSLVTVRWGLARSPWGLPGRGRGGRSCSCVTVAAVSRGRNHWAPPPSGGVHEQPAPPPHGGWQTRHDAGQEEARLRLRREWARENRWDMRVLRYVWPLSACEEAQGLCANILVFCSLLLVMATLPFSLCLVIKVVQEYERAVIFRLGLLLSGGARGPGVFFVIPCVDHYQKIDMRTQTYDVPPQEVSTHQLSALYSGKCLDSY